MSVPLLLCLVALGLSAAMSLAWAIGKQQGRSGWIDATWSYAIGVAGIIVAFAPAGTAPPFRRWLVAAAIALWSVRLGTHIVGRTLKGGDDPRYAEMRKDWGADFSTRLFGLLQIQAAAAWLLTLSVFVAAANPAPGFVWSDAAGVLILLVAVIGEGVADRQLHTFTKQAPKRGAVCTEGLWAYSRHPNYFFEWLGWTGYAVIAIGPDGSYGWGWLALSAPAFMYVLLVYISGIPPLEAHMRRSRGAAFADVERRISRFWLLPPRTVEGPPR